MDALKRVGFFRELGYGSKDGPSLHTLVQDAVQPFEAKIVTYLNSGACLAASPGMVKDVLDEAAGYIDGGPYLFTDGIWLWLKELAYYVEHYHIRLPDDFVTHMKQHDFIIPELSDADVRRLSETLDLSRL